MVYGNNDPKEREDLWLALSSIKSTVTNWVVLGDFNVVQDVSERLSFTPPVLEDIRAFNESILHCHVEDITGSGCEYTWTNKQDDHSRVWPKLDRALANPAWFTTFPVGVSNHSPILVSVFEDPYITSRFSFLNFWISHPSYRSIVTQAWQAPVQGSAMFQVFGKLKSVRTGLFQLHKSHYSDLSSRVYKAKTTLLAHQEELLVSPFSLALINKERLLLADYWDLKNAEMSMFKQKDKIDHINHGDCFSNIFAPEFKSGNNIKLMVDSLIEMVGKELGRLMLQMAGHEKLTQPVTIAEIISALFSIGSDKSPGPDGLSSAFFKDSWDLISYDFCNVVQEFFRTRKMCKQASSTLITLIPKKKVSSSVLDFSHISCCTTLYKTVSKVLANRLKVTLPYLIVPEQAAFVAGRSIFENIMLSQSLVRNYGRKYLTPRSLIKVDIQKAFDSLQWDFIRRESGIRQGDPLSPYRFVLSMEILSRYLRQLNSQPLVSLYPKCSKIKLTHLVFPDDPMLFVRGELRSVKGAVRKLDAFASLSGLKSNINKTEIYFGGVSPDVKALILNSTGFAEGSFSFRYLGIPLNSSRNSAEVYGTLITKIQNSLLHWSNSLRSYAGIIQILNSVFFGIANFCILKVKNEILAITGSVDATTSIVSSWTRNEKFHLAKAYDWFRGKGSVVNWCKALRRKLIVPSHHFTATLAAQKRLPTMDLLTTRGMHMVKRCTLCKNSGIESATCNSSINLINLSQKSLFKETIQSMGAKKRHASQKAAAEPKPADIHEEEVVEIDPPARAIAFKYQDSVFSALQSLESSFPEENLLKTNYDGF
ncbi:uncharacterized protein LOC141601980 [Silene latifolia]|uniref:uncharacterized protein LOC141601980 n=1 Tax=Silene latifolia TaxID=37657 RepID=UPI003D774362